jgi:small-conductance mechanosensitive channel
MENFITIDEFNLWQSLLLGNSFAVWTAAITAFLVIAGLIKFFLYFFSKKLNKIYDRTGIEVFKTSAEAIVVFGWPFYLLASLYISMDILDVHILIQQWVYYFFITVSIYYVIKSTMVFIDFGIKNVSEKKNGADAEKLKFLHIIIKAFIWVGAILVLLTNFGYDVTSVLAGLGIGGIAIALASQQILADIIGAFTIFFDKPFVVGDRVVVYGSIVVGEFEGEIVKIGIRSTRMKGANKEEITISNKDMANSRIRNLSRTF